MQCACSWRTYTWQTKQQIILLCKPITTTMVKNAEDTEDKAVGKEGVSEAADRARWPHGWAIKDGGHISIRTAATVTEPAAEIAADMVADRATATNVSHLNLNETITVTTAGVCCVDTMCRSCTQVQHVTTASRATRRWQQGITQWVVALRPCTRQSYQARKAICVINNNNKASRELSF